MKLLEPLVPKDATSEIRRLAADSAFSLAYKLHALERQEERGIIASDILYVLKNGYVYKPACKATRLGYYKYQIESKSPNSDSRSIRLVVIPNFESYTAKLVTIMWADEYATCAGTIMEE